MPTKFIILSFKTKNINIQKMSFIENFIQYTMQQQHAVKTMKRNLDKSQCFVALKLGDNHLEKGCCQSLHLLTGEHTAPT
jgi:hypothetical protein